VCLHGASVKGNGRWNLYPDVCIARDNVTVMLQRRRRHGKPLDAAALYRLFRQRHSNIFGISRDVIFCAFYKPHKDTCSKNIKHRLMASTKKLKVWMCQTAKQRNDGLWWICLIVLASLRKEIVAFVKKKHCFMPRNKHDGNTWTTFQATPNLQFTLLPQYIAAALFEGMPLAPWFQLCCPQSVVPCLYSTKH